MKPFSLLVTTVLLFPLGSASADNDEARLLRFPHIQGDKIAFVYGGDIWTASASGGEARRVTSFDEGIETFPRISPDGEMIAFSGEYSGTRQVYVVPYHGGVPRQLTFYPDVGQMPPRGGYDNLVLDWTPDGRILIRSNRTPYGQRIGKYFLVDPAGGGLEVPLQIPEGGPASFSPDGTRLAYNIISREWRTWKRYRAGRAQDVFVYDLTENTIERLTQFEGTDNHPMWLGNRIYFTSDRTNTLNLFANDLDTGEIRQITHFDEFDVLFPSRGRGGVIFQNGGYLYVMEEQTERVRKLNIQLADDRPWLRPKWIEGTGEFGSYDIAPGAKRAVVEVRGEVFSLPASKGEPDNLSNSPGRRERDVRWSPDGATISYLAEVGDDYELFLYDVTGGTEKQATVATGAWITNYGWSPDSNSIVLTDRAQRVRVLDVESLAITELDRSEEAMVRSISWSSDSAWLTYSKQGVNGFDSVWVCPRDRAEPVRVTEERFDDSSPAFDPEGRYLYFVSARDFSYGDLDFDQRIYVILLRDDVESPLAYQEDREKSPATEPKKKAETKQKEDGEQKTDSEKKEDTADDTKPEKLEIEFEGIEGRLLALPLDRGSYRGLQGVKDGLLFAEGGSLHRYSLEDRSAKEVISGARGYRTTPDAKKMIYRHRSDLCIAKTASGQKAGKDPLPLDRVSLKLDPRTEWAQIYVDAWRVMRDWFYDPDMHRVDWTAMREKYRPLLPFVAHRDDLDFLIGELIGELNCGHTYVQTGESPRVARVPVGVLGCEFEADGGRYRITRIYPGEEWNDATRSPLAEPGVDARVGDYLIEIDGHALLASDNPYRLLENKVGRSVKLLLNDRPSAEGAREVVVRPTGSELQLRYIDWVRHNQEIVDRLSGGRIGYVHVPNTASSGHRELFKEFRPLARVKHAMIIDDRYNGGGHIPDRMIRELSTPVLNYWSRRHSSLSTTPQFGFEGPMAMLINGYSSSGGDAFPYYFRKVGLGPLIGKKTWGGLVGYSGSPRMIDGGGLAVPAFSFVNTDGEWDVEYFGVAPDIEVFDDPTAIQAGRDPSLEAAVEYLLGELEKRSTPFRPPVPQGPERN